MLNVVSWPSSHLYQDHQAVLGLAACPVVRVGDIRAEPGLVHQLEHLLQKHNVQLFSNHHVREVMVICQ